MFPSSLTGKRNVGKVPFTIGNLDKLQQLYLKGNLLEGNLPLSMKSMASLTIVDITDNILSGVLQFVPSFDLVGIDTNSGLLMQASRASPTVMPSTIYKSSDEDFDIVTIAGIGIHDYCHHLCIFGPVEKMQTRKGNQH
jgi:hypothetical protein